MADQDPKEVESANEKLNALHPPSPPFVVLQQVTEKKKTGAITLSLSSSLSNTKLCFNTLTLLTAHSFRETEQEDVKFVL